MKVGQQLLFGAILALLFTGILAGSALLSFTESGRLLALLPTHTATITALPAGTILAGLEQGSQITPPSNTFVPPTPTATFTQNPECPLPEGYVTYIVRPGETLQMLAARRKVSLEALAKANCFDSGDLIAGFLAPGTVIHLPENPPTQTSAICSIPVGWVRYTIQSGDTLFSLGQSVGLSWTELQRANCMGSSTRLIAGRTLFLPRYPVATPRPSVTPWASATLSWTATRLASATSQPTATQVLPTLPPAVSPSSPPATATFTSPPPPTNTLPPPATDTVSPTAAPRSTNPPPTSAPPTDQTEGTPSRSAQP